MDSNAASPATTTPASVPRSTTSTAAGPKPLSCTSCRQRKVKCNKTYPCQPCTKSGIECVFPQRVRVPRGKQRGSKARDSELLKRIGRLESLVSKVDAAKAFLEGRDAAGNADADTVTSTAPCPTREPRLAKRQRTVDPFSEIEPGSLTDSFASFIKMQEGGNRYISSEFWNTLGDEVEGLRGLLEQHVEAEEAEDLNDGNDENETASVTSDSKFSSPCVVFDFMGKAELPSHPDLLHRTILMRYYFDNVHACCPVLHQPTVTAHMLGSTELIDQASKHFKFGSIEALNFSLYFASVTSMTVEDCREYFNEERNVLLLRYKNATEAALAKADFLNSMEIVTLTAFTIYLVAARASNSTRSVWALVALAVRIAHALGLHRDGDGLQYSAFEAEMRRRLWSQIMVLDMRACEDRGSEPVILDRTYNTKLPCNIDDADFTYASKHPLQNKRGWTIMGYHLMSVDVCSVIRRLNFVPPAETRLPLTIEEKETIVKECITRIETIYSNGVDMSNPRPDIASLLGRILSLRLWSVLQYPFQKRREESNVTWPEDMALRTSINVLELIFMVHDHPDAQKFLWFYSTWVPWHPVAMALAELCKKPHGQLADRAWPIVERGFRTCSSRVADSSEGMLWKPVKKLYKKARMLRTPGKASPVTSTAQGTPQTALMSAYGSPDQYQSISYSNSGSPQNRSSMSAQHVLTPLSGTDPVLYPRHPNHSQPNTMQAQLIPNYSPGISNQDYSNSFNLDWMPHGGYGGDVVIHDNDAMAGQVNWDIWHDFMFDNDMSGGQNMSAVYGSQMDMRSGVGISPANDYYGWNMQS